MTLKGENGYNISYDECIPNNCKTIVIAMHGFAGDKSSGCIKLLEDRLKQINVGLLKFDWPGHGESETNGDDFTVHKCLSDLNSIVKYIRKEHNDCNLVAFSTSFGGYLTLLYNYYNPNVFNHIILRSPAIKMYDVVKNNLMTEQMKLELRKNGYFHYGFERILKVSLEFINELRDENVFKLYGDKDLNYISIIHGTDDDVVPISDSKLFSDIHNCTIYPIEGADHRYKKNGELDEVIEIATDIISNVENNRKKL